MDNIELFHIMWYDTALLQLASSYVLKRTLHELQEQSNPAQDQLE